MSDRPMLFSAPTVRALLAGTKTQTRRVISPEHVMVSGSHAAGLNLCWKERDRLWVRESWSHTGSGVWTIADARSGLGGGHVIYAADGPCPGAKYWPSIHMPREFSRLTLHVTDVRVQRLQDITNEDCLAEGIPDVQHSRVPKKGPVYGDERRSLGLISHYGFEYRALWEKINGKGAWDANPWIVAISFTVERTNIDRLKASA